MTDPDEVISNEGATTGRWLRAMADMEHETPDDEPDAGDARRDQREESDRE